MKIAHYLHLLCAALIHLAIFSNSTVDRSHLRAWVAKICPLLKYAHTRLTSPRSSGPEVGFISGHKLYFKVQAHKQKEHLHLRFSSTRQGENCECHPENSFLFIIWAAIRYCFIIWAAIRLFQSTMGTTSRGISVSTSVTCVAGKSLYITWLIHKEQFTYQVHQLGIVQYWAFGELWGGCMVALVFSWLRH